MINPHKAVTLSLASFGLFLSAAATAGTFLAAEEAPIRSVESCVAEIGEHADYSNAGRVRHVVVNTGRRSLAYKLRIETKVFGAEDDEVIREYTTKCIVYGDNKPVRFRIREISA